MDYEFEDRLHKISFWVALISVGLFVVLALVAFFLASTALLCWSGAFLIPYIPSSIIFVSYEA